MITIKKITLSLFLLAFGIGNCQTVNDSTVAIQLPSRNTKIAITATVDTGIMLVGDQRQLHIKVCNLLDGKQMPPIALPTLDMLTNNDVEALTCTIDTTARKDGTIESIEQNVTLTSFIMGRHPITGIVIMTEEGGSAMLLAPEDSLFLETAYASTADTTRCEMREDDPYQKEPLTPWDFIRWVLMLWGIVCIVGAIMIILQSKKHHKPIPFLPKAKPVPADRRALNELENLRRKELWQKGRIKKYYTDMTDIVRRFLHNMYGISAAEMTSRQTLRAFHNISDWNEESERLLRQLLHQADMVKFAKSQPETHEHDMAMQNAINFIQKVAETHKLRTEDEERETENGN